SVPRTVRASRTDAPACLRERQRRRGATRSKTVASYAPLRPRCLIRTAAPTARRAVRPAAPRSRGATCSLPASRTRARDLQSGDGPRGLRPGVEQAPIRLERPSTALAEQALELARQILALARFDVGAPLAEHP